jgi:hypothetical protein
MGILSVFSITLVPRFSQNKIFGTIENGDPKAAVWSLAMNKKLQDAKSSFATCTCSLASLRGFSYCGNHLLTLLDSRFYTVWAITVPPPAHKGLTVRCGSLGFLLKGQEL